MAASVFNDRVVEGGGVRAEINVTPLVDVMLVLLIIFMVTAPALAMRADVNLPQAGPEPPVKPPSATLEVGAGGQWWVDGVAMDRSAALEELQALARRAPDAILTVRSQGDADYQVFIDALEVAQASGLRNIGTTAQ